MRTVRLPVIKKSTVRKRVSDYMSRKSNRQQLHIIGWFLFLLLACSVLAIIYPFI